MTTDRRLFLFGFQEKGRERRQGQAQREGPAVCGLSIGVNASQISHAASAVFLGIAVQKLPPESAGGHAYPVSVARYGSEITHDHNLVGRESTLAQQGNNTGSGVIAVDPLEPGGVGVELVQRGLLAI